MALAYKYIYIKYYYNSYSFSNTLYNIFLLICRGHNRQCGGGGGLPVIIIIIITVANGVKHHISSYILNRIASWPRPALAEKSNESNLPWGQHPIKKPEHRKVLRVHEKFFRF